MFMYSCIHIIHIHILVRMCIMSVCIYMYEYVSICIYMYMYVYVCIYLYLVVYARMCMYCWFLEKETVKYKCIYVHGGQALHRLAPSSCTCPPRIQLSTSSRCRTSSAACPCSRRGITARSPATCRVAKTPAFLGAGATGEGRRERAASCSTSTRGP